MQKIKKIIEAPWAYVHGISQRTSSELKSAEAEKGLNAPRSDGRGIPRKWIKKYYLVFTNTWHEYMIYRLNFILWRFRTFLALIFKYFLWLALVGVNSSVFNYNLASILTYILGTSFVASVVLSTRTAAVGDQINSGDLSNFLIRPINYLYYWFARDLGDKVLNIFFSIFEIAIIITFFKPKLFIQTNLAILIIFLAAILLAAICYFFISFLLSLVGFWTPEVWAPRFISFIIIEFFTGNLFPLDILPKQIFNFLQILPFSYLIFFPLKIYLGQLNTQQILQGFLICTFWIVFFYAAFSYVFKKGLRIYSAQGR